MGVKEKQGTSQIMTNFDLNLFIYNHLLHIGMLCLCIGMNDISVMNAVNEICC